MNKLMGLFAASFLSACAGNADVAQSNQHVELGKIDIAALKDALPKSDRAKGARHDVRGFCYTGNGFWCVLTSGAANSVNSFYGVSSVGAGDIVMGDSFPDDASDDCSAEEFGGSNGGACQVSNES